MPGQGLTGMAERVGLYDGTLTTEGGPDGFRVTAVFPFGGKAGDRMTRVLVADDQTLVRGGFCALLDATEGIEGRGRSR